MKVLAVGALSVAALMATTAAADDTRQLGAHEHGVSVLNIAIDGDKVVMELASPGADIVGFEHEAKSAEDKAAVEKAEADLAKPLSLFAFPADAQCSVDAVDAHLVVATEDEHDHDHGDHGHAEHADDDHGHKDHGHDDHGHKDHSHDDHGHGHDDHDHALEAGHSEFLAEYAMTCANIGALTSISFPFFERFPNAEEIEATLVTAKGQTSYEVEAAADAAIDLSGAI